MVTTLSHFDRIVVFSVAFVSLFYVNLVPTITGLTWFILGLGLFGLVILTVDFIQTIRNIFSDFRKK